MTMPYMNIEKASEAHPQRDQEQRRERQRLWPPIPIRILTSAINSHFWKNLFCPTNFETKS